MILIADSSALIALAVCNSLELLDKLFQEVKVPYEVFKEVTKESKKESEVLHDYLKDKILEVEIDTNIIIRDGTLELGELEAMTLYKQMNADWLLVDDKRARKIAEINQIKIIGSLGVLLLGKNKGFIKNLNEVIEILKKSDIFFSEKLFQKILNLSNE